LTWREGKMSITKLRSSWPTAAVTFFLGVLATFAVLSARTRFQREESVVAPAELAAPRPTPCGLDVTSRAPQPEEDEWPRLAEDAKWRPKLNGLKLPLDYESGVPAPEEIPHQVDSAKVHPLASGHLLVNYYDTLYRLDSEGREVWAHGEAQMIFDFAYVEATNLIYGTAGDNVMFILDAATGERVHAESRNGSAAYGVAVPYGRDQCLVKDNFVMYRMKAKDFNEASGHEPMQDGITAWRGSEVLWHSDFPPDAEPLVVGEKIYAVTKTKSGIYIKPIAVPKIGKK
jgi:hypothetical protein